MSSQRTDLDGRESRFLAAVIDHHLKSAVPVASRTLARAPWAGISPASIRAILAKLESRGYLRRPHASAGRVPTDQGYRYYVDRLMPRRAAPPEDRALMSEAVRPVRVGSGKEPATIAEALRCAESGEEKVILMSLCGHGHFDLQAYESHLAGHLEDFTLPQERIDAALAHLPAV